jgi:hypothetical protein
MGFSTYHIYVDAISQRDQAVLTIGIIVLVAFEILLVLHRFRPAWARPAAWIFIGGFYASLLAMVMYLGSGT